MDNRLTTNQGAPVGDNQHSRTAGQRGPALLEDYHLLEKLAHFDRERIPERVVHARGAGAHGVFRTENSMKAYTKAHFLQEAGKETRVFVRFSTVIHGTGSPETARDPRGFAVKFYTEEGNLDIVGNHLPVFFIRDAIKFPDMVHSLKPAPDTNIQDPNRYWDFMTLTPESTHMMTWLFSDDGTPASYREMDGFGVHAFKWINAEDKAIYVKYQWKSKQGVRNFTAEEASAKQAQDFNHATRDLYEAIQLGNHPEWELYVQLLPTEHVDRYAFDPLDPTKVWPEDMYPLQKVGTMTLNRNPINYFSEVEQSAFAPSALVPGIEPSEDKLLQGRLFSYPDTQRYRLGANYLNIPVNCPYAPARNHQRDGAMTMSADPSPVNYEPNSASDSPKEDAAYKDSYAPLQGSAGRQRIDKTDDFTQAGDRYLSLTPELRSNLVNNLIGDLSQTSEDIQLRAVCNFFRANVELGTRLSEGLGVDIRKYVPQG
ncbi:catalase [Paenibacillus radicis (ex Gao et al. 2016)]|uniref:Catalase n=1 Tax=Paenibacillus radicis (ex Gao et al. 2016) TaxID=1737354 RepID=A0A917M3Z8_9BACL|nr:catalase [Paenibacillus radicis (ex Gao et al. 2016)]GGG74003.1 catalase [Paenibacillus radicis (ex Gao et al. 2016)]